jgi:diacylglycerol kinase (ATP)
VKQILVLLNPKSRSGADAQTEAIETFQKLGYAIIQPPAGEGKVDVNALILKYRNQIDCVLIGGGDGSVNEALPALVQTQLPLLLFPLGTANNLARTYQLPSNMSECAKLLQTGQTIQIDLGTVNDIYFVNVAGIGFSAKINRSVSGGLKKYFGVFAFILTALQLALKARPFRATITCDNQKVQSLSWQISVCNGRHYGSGLTIQEDATLQDQLLHCLSLEIRSLWHGLGLIPALHTGRYRERHSVSLVVGKQLLIETPHPKDIDVDGDIRTKTPARFAVHPGLLKMIVPQ